MPHVWEPIPDPAGEDIPEIITDLRRSDLSERGVKRPFSICRRCALIRDEATRGVSHVYRCPIQGWVSVPPICLDDLWDEWLRVQEAKVPT